MSENNKTIDQMAAKFHTVTELQAYADSQFNTIINLNKKINELENKNRSLEEMLAKSVPIVKENASEIQLLASGTDEEVICKIQLNMLKNRVISGEELTMEETKKADIYARLLLAIKQGDVKGKEKLAEKVDEGQLLDFLKDFNPNEMK